ncbi:MAG: 16S rRNA (cytosine(1402)-N(4))-methyltransferase RsmH [Eubacteriales bacterium]
MDGHVSVLLNQSLDILSLQPGMTVVDGTLGGGGHALEILKRITPGGTLLGIDKDEEAIKRVLEFLPQYKENMVLINDDFKNIKRLISEKGFKKVNAAILDLGVSSFQLDEASRGFSYQSDAKLDMRMDLSQSKSAYDVINKYSEGQLREVISSYGEERWAARIAKFIADKRSGGEIKTTGELTSIIKAAIPKGARLNGPHPAKRTFQAIRIEVNDELSSLKEAIEDFADVIVSGGRLSVITFHSLEDRIVKRAFLGLANPCTCPPDAPVCVCGLKPKVKILLRKPIIPEEDEVLSNPRSRSAKLRAIEIL